MENLTIIEGKGHLLSNGKKIGKVEYSIDVFQDDEAIIGYGHIQGDFTSLCDGDLSNVELVLSDGQSVAVDLQSIQPSEGIARIVTMGQIRVS